VKYIARIKVVSDNRPRRVDAIDDGALARASACAWRIERGDDAVRGAHKAVKDVARIKVRSRDSPRRVDESRGSPPGVDESGQCALAGACTQHLERRTW